MDAATTEKAFDFVEKLSQRIKDDELLTLLYYIFGGVFLYFLANVCVPPYLKYRANNLESERKWAHNNNKLQDKIDQRAQRSQNTGKK